MTACLKFALTIALSLAVVRVDTWLCELKVKQLNKYRIKMINLFFVVIFYN